jgi:PAS domain-containing protein
MPTLDGGNERFIHAITSALPLPIFVIDGQMRILDANEAGARLQGDEQTLERLCGEALHCINHHEHEGGCGSTRHCDDCVIQSAVHRALGGERVVRLRAEMTLLQADGARRAAHYLVTASPFKHAEQAYALVVLEDVSELVELRELLPICAGCKKIRDDQGYWEHVEGFLTRHVARELTHGLCPSCEQRYYSDL